MKLSRNSLFMRGVRDQMAQRVTRAAHAVRDKAVALIEEPKSGVFYRGKERPASEPGEPPANQSGELAGSIAVFGPIITDTVVEAHVATLLIKGRILEAGTFTMAPRPFLLPALLDSRDKILKAVGGEGSRG